MNYKIIGADGKTYGPVPADQIRAWIAAGRVENRTPIFAEGAADWTFVGLLPEFAIHLPTTPPIISGTAPAKTNSFATAGFIFGILSLICCCGCPFNVLGVIFSLIALAHLHAHPEQEGRGLAIAGLICSIVSLLVTLGLGFWQLAFNPPNVAWQLNHF